MTGGLTDELDIWFDNIRYAPAACWVCSEFIHAPHSSYVLYRAIDSVDVEQVEAVVICDDCTPWLNMRWRRSQHHDRILYASELTSDVVFDCAKPYRPYWQFEGAALSGRFGVR